MNEQQIRENERDRIITYLKDKGVLRDAMFYPGLVAHAEFLDSDNFVQWKAIDLPVDLGASETPEGGN